MDVITVEMLRTKHACSPELEKFQELFGSQVTVTVELAVQHADTFDWDWAGWELLAGEQLSAFREAMQAAIKRFNEAIEVPHRQYREAVTAARQERAADPGSPWDAYSKKIGAAGDIYGEATAPALTQLHKAQAAAFATAFLRQTQEEFL